MCFTCKTFSHILMCLDDDIVNTNDTSKNEIYETSTLINNSNVENVSLMTSIVKVKI